MVVHKIVVVFASLCTTFGILLAWRTPATGYELSIYSATPTGYWIGISFAVFIGICYAMYEGASWNVRWCNIGIGAIAALSVAALPRIRGYYYYGNIDAATHLGTTKSVIANAPWHESTLYPALSSFSATTSLVTDVSPREGMLYGLIIFVGIFFISVPSLAREIDYSKETPAVAAVSAWMLLPLMSVRLPTLYPIPNTIATFVFPLILFSMLVFIRREENSHFWHLLLFFALTVLLHPTVAISLAIISGGLWILSDGVSTITGRSLIPFNVQLIPVLIGCLFLAWITRYGSRFAYFYQMVNVRVSGPGGDVESAGESLSRIGVSIGEIILKIMGPKLVFLAFVCALFCYNAYRILSDGGDETSEDESFQIAVTVTLLPLGFVLAVFFALGVSNMFGRFIGLTMGPVTVLGAIGVTRLKRSHRPTVLRNSIPKVAALLVLVVVSALTMTTMHPSPEIVRPSQQVTDTQLTAYGHAFDTQSEDANVAGLYTRPHRFRDAYYGNTETSSFGEVRPNWERVEYARPPPSLRETLETGEPHWEILVVTDSAKEIHLELFESEVQSASDFSALDERTNRVYDNGGATTYVMPKMPSQYSYG